MEVKKISIILSLVFLFALRAQAQMNAVDNPVGNFEELWKIFDQRYANFELKEIDWGLIHENYRSEVHANTTNAELFDICCAMLQELEDGHVSIEADFTEATKSCGPPYVFVHDIAFDTHKKWEAFQSLISQKLSANGFSDPEHIHITEETNFQYRQSDQWGYIRIDEMTERLSYWKVDKAMKKALNSFSSAKGLIIDLRFNGGGWDFVSYRLARHLIPPGQHSGHYERSRVKGTDRYTRMKYRKIKSKGTSAYDKPIVILTSDFTASAAEVFLLLMKDLDHVTIIGDNTEGIFSDMFEFDLPNGWEVSLSHQQYFSSDKVNYEGVGITPDILIKNSAEDLNTKVDPVLREALKYLEKHH